MKKFLSIFFAFLMILPCAVVLTACDKDTYKVSSCTYAGAVFMTDNNEKEFKMTRSQYKKSYGKKNWDFENATTLERMAAMYAVGIFAHEIKLEKDGYVTINFNYPKWCKDLEPASGKTDYKWEERDGKIYINGTEYAKNGSSLTGNCFWTEGTVVYK